MGCLAPLDGASRPATSGSVPESAPRKGITLARRGRQELWDWVWLAKAGAGGMKQAATIDACSADR